MKNLLSILYSSLLLISLYPTDARAASNPPLSAATVSLDNFKLTGDLSGEQAAFTLTTTAHVENPKGGSLEILSGTVALTEVGPHPKWRIRPEQNRFILLFERGGHFPLQLKFKAAVRDHDGWKSVEFHVPPSALQRVVLHGLAADTQFEFPGAARPELSNNAFVSFLPPDGAMKLSWKQAPKETEGKLFYSAEMLSQISVGPGLMRQVALLNFKVMQGDLKQVTLQLKGTGEVTRVQGDQVLAWTVEPVPGSSDRLLVVQFNQAQKDQFSLQVHAQTPLGAFPQFADVLRLVPEAATRFAGYFRVMNEGAVRLEIVQASGLSQISPEQFPESDATRAAWHITGNQRFAYRLSGPEFALRIQADQIVPEFELEIRDAPLRELLLHVPRGYAIARLNAQGMSDYFLTEPADQPDADLR